MNYEGATDLKRSLRFGFLSTVDAPMLPFYLAAARSNGCDDLVVICDSVNFSSKNLRLWKERTNGAFDAGFLGVSNISDLAEAKVPFYFVRSHNDDQSFELIDRLGIDCLFNAGTPRKLDTRIINSVPHGVVNVHPGLLPEYRGCSCVEWAVLQNDKVGNTAHFIDEGYDSGPIIDAEWYEFPRTANYAEIRTRVYQGSCEMAGKVLAMMQEKRLRPVDCQKQPVGTGTYWDPISTEDMERVLRITESGAYRYQCIGHS
ncbi:formyltransferase family protein [Alphaproteobacteria bacterium]|nr:formyltransferase family protein [Alphaproteobacteria bacterium]